MSTTIETHHPHYDPKVHTFIAINVDYGGFGLSRAAKALIVEKLDDDSTISYRTNPKVLSAFKQLGQEAADSSCKPAFCMVLKDLAQYYRIREVDGAEDVDFTFNADRYWRMKIECIYEEFEEIAELTKKDMIAELKKLLEKKTDGSEFPILSLERFRVTYQEYY